MMTMRQYTRDEVAALKAMAAREVVDLDLDSQVRQVAKSGKSDGGPNWERVYHVVPHQPLVIRCTDGAGTNSASVHIQHVGNETDAAYYAHHYGTVLVAYRRGSWVETIQQLAEQAKADEDQRQAIRQQEEINRAATPFLPWPE